MIRFMCSFRKRKFLSSTSTAKCRSNLPTQEAPPEAQTLQQNHCFFRKFKIFSKRRSPEYSSVLSESTLEGDRRDSKGQIDEEDLEVFRSGTGSGRTFARFEELPIELRLVIWEYYLQTPRITTINFQSDTVLCSGLRSFRLICGSLPPIICINHKYRETFLPRFTVPGPPTSLTTLSLGNAQLQFSNGELSTASGESSANAFPVFATCRRHKIVYDPKDTVWIQGDFWLDELRRSTIARSVFYHLRHLAIPYKTRNQTLFEEEDMWDLVGCIMSTFPFLETITMVLDAGEAIAERPIHNGEVYFTTPESIKMTTDVPDDTPPTTRETLSSIWKLARGKPIPQKYETKIEHWTAEEVGDDAHRILKNIKARAIHSGHTFRVNSWETPREIADWVVPPVRVVTANLSTASRTQEILEPTIKVIEW